jgi:hypothetical protein
MLKHEEPNIANKARDTPLGSARPSQDTAKTIDIQGNIEKHSGNIEE